MSEYNIVAGNLLVAEPFMDDENFKRSVVLITENDHTGTLGLILNRPSIFRLNEVLPDFPKFDAQVYLGGPIGLDRLNFVHSYNDLIPKSIHIADKLYWNGDYEALKKAVSAKKILPHNIKFFLGYAGWGVGQLEDEMKERSWIIARNYHNIFKASQYMWKDVLEKMGGKYKIIANSPEHPSLN